MTTVKTENPLDIQKEIKKHITIYIWLLILTAINFSLSRMHLSATQTLIGVLSIAAIQAALVLCYFMHLLSEKKLTHFVLILTVVFFLALISLPVLQFIGRLYGSVHVA